MKSKKIISLLLVAALVIAALSFFVVLGFVSGNNDKEETQNSTTDKPNKTEPHTEYEYVDGGHTFPTSVPEDLDFEGLELTVLCRGEEAYTREWTKEEYTDSELDKQTEYRNAVVQEELGLKFKLETVNSNGDWDDWINKINDAVINDAATEQKYDLYAHNARDASSLELRGMQANMLNKEKFPHFDFGHFCWNESIVGQAISDKLYYVAGDLNLSMFDQTVVIWHNKTLYDKYKTSADPEDLQKVANDNKFTYDMLYRWAELYVGTTSGDACDATYGISDLNSAFYEAVPYAWKLKLISENKDNTHSINLPVNEKAEEILTSLRDLRAQSGVNNCQAELDGADCSVGLVGHFVNGQSMFMPNTVYLGGNNNQAIREMKDTYCVLPVPKYSIEQKDYASTAITDFNLMSIPNHKKAYEHGEAISAFLQRMTELSCQNLLGVYIEEMLMPANFNSKDDEEVDVLALSIMALNDAMEKLTFDTVSIYGSAIENFGWNMGEMVEKYTLSFEEYWTSELPEANGQTPAERFQQIYQKLRELDIYMIDTENPKYE